MNIGLFGLSGVGKSYLATQLCKVDEHLICVRASEIIKSYGHHIQYHQLKHNVVEGNQHILINGFKQFISTHPNTDIIIELHNVIESPEGSIDIDDIIFTQLNLDAVCFIELNPEQIIKQRSEDSGRVRHITSATELSNLQTHSKQKFLNSFSSSSIPYIILKQDHLQGLRSFITSLR